MIDLSSNPRGIEFDFALVSGLNRHFSTFVDSKRNETLSTMKRKKESNGNLIVEKLDKIHERVAGRAVSIFTKIGINWYHEDHHPTSVVWKSMNGKMNFSSVSASQPGHRAVVGKRNAIKRELFKPIRGP